MVQVDQRVVQGCDAGVLIGGREERLREVAQPCARGGPHAKERETLLGRGSAQGRKQLRQGRRDGTPHDRELRLCERRRGPREREGGEEQQAFGQNGSV